MFGFRDQQMWSVCLLNGTMEGEFWATDERMRKG